MCVRAKRVGNSEHVDFSDIMGTVAGIKKQLHREKLVVELKAPSVAELIATKYIHIPI